MACIIVWSSLLEGFHTAKEIMVGRRSTGRFLYCQKVVGDEIVVGDGAVYWKVSILQRRENVQGCEEQIVPGLCATASYACCRPAVLISKCGENAKCRVAERACLGKDPSGVLGAKMPLAELYFSPDGFRGTSAAVTPLMPSECNGN